MSLADKPIYPATVQDDQYCDLRVRCGYGGMTLLEHYVGLAMLGICINAGRNGHKFHEPDKIADTAEIQARAMIAKLEKNK